MDKNKAKLRELVEKNFLDLGLPNPVTIEILTEKEVYPNRTKGTDRFRIKMDIGELSELGLAASHFDMWYTPRKKRLDGGALRLAYELRKKGLGRKLIEARENLAKQLGCLYVKISMCTNPGFFEHMGYRKTSGNAITKTYGKVLN